MALTNSFYEAVKEGNVRRVRIMMKDSLLVDLTFTDFNNMEKAAHTMSGLYDEHDGREFIVDPSQWNDDYMDKLMVQVVNNFSHVRIDHLKDVVRHLRPVTKATQSAHTENRSTYTRNSTSESSYQKQKYRDQKNGDYLYAKIGVGTVAGAVVGGVISAIACAPAAGIIGGIAAGAVVGGVTTAIIFNGGK